MFKSHYTFAGILVLAGLLMVAGGAAAFGIDLESDQIPPPTPSVPDPTERDAKTKDAEASQPTASAVPAVAVCPTDIDVCEFGSALVAALSASPAQLMGLSMATTLQCRSTDAPDLQPRCSAGGVQSGFFTGVVAKSYGFVGDDEFRRFVSAIFQDAGGVPRLISIGCPGTRGDLDCDNFAVLTVRGESQDVILVVLTAKSAAGDRRIIGARRWAAETPEVTGGPVSYEQIVLPYRGPMFFQPVTLP
jgi:hypothetical protein